MEQPPTTLPVDARLLLLGAAACLLVLLLGVVLVLIVRVLRRRQTPAPAPLDLTIDVSQLPATGPPATGPRLECYGTPVRLAVLVLAPAGRASSLPGREEFLAVLDDLLPGLSQVIAAHQPIVRRWPSQLSTQGFTQAFFGHARLPGDRGKGTVWCSVAGRFEAGNRQLLAGLICVADRPNSLGQIAVQHTGQWLDVLRVRT